MAAVTDNMDAEHADSLGRRYLIRFEEDTLKSRPLWIRLIIEFLGTFVLVTVAAGSGVINHYVGGGPVSRAAAVIAPGAVVMAVKPTPADAGNATPLIPQEMSRQVIVRPGPM